MSHNYDKEMAHLKCQAQLMEMIQVIQELELNAIHEKKDVSLDRFRWQYLVALSREGVPE